MTVRPLCSRRRWSCSEARTARSRSFKSWPVGLGSRFRLPGVSHLAASPSSVVHCDATAISMGGRRLSDDENGTPSLTVTAFPGEKRIHFTIQHLERRESASSENGNSRILTRKAHLGSMFGRASDHCQVLASLKSAEASREVRVAISLGGQGRPCSSHQVMASTNSVDTRSGTNSSEKVWTARELASGP